MTDDLSVHLQVVLDFVVNLNSVASATGGIDTAGSQHLQYSLRVAGSNRL
jgi:hypothetical protein